MAFKLRGRPVINGSAQHKSARSEAVKKAADDQFRQSMQSQQDANTPLALRGRLQDRINERLNRNVTIGTRRDDEGNEVVTKTVERDRLFGGGRTSRTRDKRNWDIENVAPENRAQERTVDPPQELHTDDGQGPIVAPDMTGPTYPPDPPRNPTPISNFPIEEGKPPKYGWDDPGLPKDPIVDLPAPVQDKLVEDITDENVDDQTILQEYGNDALEALGYIFIPGYGLVKEGMAMYEQGIPEYMDRFGGVIEGLGEWLFGGDEEEVQSSGEEQTPISRHRPTNPQGPVFWEHPTDRSDYWHWNRQGGGVYKKKKR